LSLDRKQLGCSHALLVSIHLRDQVFQNGLAFYYICFVSRQAPKELARKAVFAYVISLAETARQLGMTTNAVN